MKTIGQFKHDGVQMYAMAADDGGMESILERPLLAFAAVRLRSGLDSIAGCPIAGEFGYGNGEFSEVVLFDLHTTWRIFLASDGGGQVGVYVDTGDQLDEADILDVDPEVGVAGPFDLMDRIKDQLKLLSDAELKEKLLALAKSGAPRPAADSELGRALARFTTEPQAA